MKLSFRCFLYLSLSVALAAACTDKIDRSDMYTFTGMTATDYIRSNPELSLFSKIIEKSHNSSKSLTTVASLLSTYGNYTVFAPTNDAIKQYLDSVYEQADYNVDTISQAEANRIVLNCILDNGKEQALRTMDLNEGALVQGTLDDHHIIVNFGDYGDGATVKLNRKSRIIKGDMQVTNGYIHIVDRVITPGPTSVAGLIYDTPNLRIFSMLLEKTSWGDSLLKYEDKVYNDETYYKLIGNSGTSTSAFPRYRLFCFTCFVEPDEIFHQDWGIPMPQQNPRTGGMANAEEIMEAIEARCKEAYPQAQSNDPKNEGNAVNQFVSYHLLPSLEKYSGWKNVKGVFPTLYKNTSTVITRADFPFYFQTMGKPNRLMKIVYSTKRNDIRINRHCYYNNAFYGDYQETSCAREGCLIDSANGSYPNYAPNGYYYPINHVLVYDEDTRKGALNERIRYDVTMNLPELRTYMTYRDYISRLTCIPATFCDNIKTKSLYTHNSSSTSSQYIFNSSSTDIFIYYMWDHLSFCSNEVTLKLLPVPYAGIWEVRIGRLHGMIQLYMGNSTNITQMKYLGIKDYYSKNGYVPPQEADFDHAGIQVLHDTLSLIETNKNCRLHGFMKYPYGCGKVQSTGYHYYVWYSSRNAKPQNSPINPYRHIVYRGYMTPEKDYYIRMVSQLGSEDLSSAWWQGDLIELVPESVFDNPNRAEDWW